MAKTETADRPKGIKAAHGLVRSIKIVPESLERPQNQVAEIVMRLPLGNLDFDGLKTGCAHYIEIGPAQLELGKSPKQPAKKQPAKSKELFPESDVQDGAIRVFEEWEIKIPKTLGMVAKVRCGRGPDQVFYAGLMVTFWPDGRGKNKPQFQVDDDPKVHKNHSGMSAKGALNKVPGLVAKFRSTIPNEMMTDAAEKKFLAASDLIEREIGIIADGLKEAKATDKKGKSKK